MDTSEWFEGVLGWEYGLTGFGQPVWVSPEGEQVYINPPPILEEQEAWIQYVVKPMRGMGYELTIIIKHDGGMLWWGKIDTNGDYLIVHEAEIIDDNLFQASLDAAEKCPEVKEKLGKWRNK